MLTFIYTARDTASNKKIKSTVQAESQKSAAKLLMAQGMIPIEIIEQSQAGGPFDKLLNRVGTKDKVIFTRQLATLINAGLPLAQSLHTVQEQTENKKLKAIAQDIITSIEGGKSLAESFSQHPDVFDEIFIALVAAGEVSGTLDKALERIADQQEKDAEIIAKVRGAMVYPGIVMLVIGLVIVFMLTTVVPQIEKLYVDLRQELPFVTAVMVKIANIITTFWWLILGLMGGAVYFGKRYLETDGGKSVVDRLKLSIPLFGPMFKKLYMARLARTGQTLMSTGVPMLETLKITSQAVNNVHVSAAIDRAAEKVKGGKALSVALQKEEVILPLVPQMISIGEQSGGIDAMMGKAATFYENELDNTIRSISTAIEPILMVVLAGVAGVMVAAILLPVYGLIGSGAVR
jgi:type IV pilus assembly protein PilC